MSEKRINVSNLSIVELKAEIFDRQQVINQNQREIEILLNVLQQKQQTPKVESVNIRETNFEKETD